MFTGSKVGHVDKDFASKIGVARILFLLFHKLLWLQVKPIMVIKKFHVACFLYDSITKRGVCKDRVIPKSFQVSSSELWQFDKRHKFKVQIILDVANPPFLLGAISAGLVLKRINESGNRSALILFQILPAPWHCVKLTVTFVVEILSYVNDVFHSLNVFIKRNSGGWAQVKFIAWFTPVIFLSLFRACIVW